MPQESPELAASGTPEPTVLAVAADGPAAQSQTATATQIIPEPSLPLDPADPRYPRSVPEHAIRWVLQRPLVWLLAYLATVATNLALLIWHHGLSALRDGNALAQTLLFNQLPLLQPLGPPAALLVVPLVPIVWLLIRAGRAAQQDDAREQQVVLLRAALPAVKSAAREQAVQIVPLLVTAELEQRGFALAEASAALPNAPPLDLTLLPVPDTFVGRAEDLAWVTARLVQGGTTAITALGGIGGIGKTALAGVAVRELRKNGRFRGGVAVVSCAGKANATEVLREVLARFMGGRTPDAEGDAALASVARQLLTDRDALIVLDNVEPELRELARVVTPLREAGATLLLTARHDLPASAVPPGAGRRLDVLAAAEAQALFTQLLTTTSSGDWVLTASETVAVARIVQTLGRHTLALRLAALYAGQTGRDLAQLAAELASDPLRLAADDETPRGVALVLGRSVNALSPQAQQLFTALAAFPTAEFGRHAALALAERLEIPDPPTAVDLLVRRALLDAELNGRMPAESDRERLRLHPLLRAFAAEQFAAWPDAARTAASRAVAAHYADYATAVPDVALAADDDNIAGVLEWLHIQVQPQTQVQAHPQQQPQAPAWDTLLARLCAGMRTSWRDRGRTQAALRFLPWGIAAAERLAATSGAPDDRLQLARLELVYGQMGVVLTSLGDVAQLRGQLVAAQQYYEQALVIDREVQDRRSEGAVLASLARIAGAYDDLDRAETLHRESLAIAREVQNRQDIADSLLTLGQLLITTRGQRDEGCAMLREAISLYHQMGVPREANARQVAQALGCDLPDLDPDTA